MPETDRLKAWNIVEHRGKHVEQIAAELGTLLHFSAMPACPMKLLFWPEGYVFT